MDDAGDRKQPPVDKVLVDWLTAVYPNRCPHILDTEREIWCAVGRQEIIRKLRSLSETQQTQVL